MKKFLILKTLFLVLSWQNIIMPAICGIRTWKKDNCHVEGLYDLHYFTPSEEKTAKNNPWVLKFAKGLKVNDVILKINLKQAKDFIKSIKTHNKEDCLVIVENPDTEKCDHIECKKLVSDPTFCFMSYVEKFCKKEKIPAINVEYRHMLQMAQDDAQYIDTAVKDLDSIHDELSQYNDNEILNKFYKQICSTIVDLKNKYELFYSNIEHDIKSKDQENKVKQKFYVKQIEELRLDSKILDAKILHIIHQNKNKKHIFICAGGAHIYYVGRMLEKCGYIEKSSQGSSFTKIPADLDNNKLDSLLLTKNVTEKLIKDVFSIKISNNSTIEPMKSKNNHYNIIIILAAILLSILGLLKAIGGRYIKLACLSLIILIPNIINCATIKIDLWQKDGQNLIEFSDIHKYPTVDIDKINKLQANEFHKLISHLDKDQCLVILENKKCNHRLTCSNKQYQQAANLMPKIDEICKKEEIETINVEFRHLLDTALVKQKNSEYTKEAIENLQDILNEIGQYKDNNEILQNFYQAICKKLKNYFLNEDYLMILKKIKQDRFDSVILDARICHEIFNSDKKYIFVFAGNGHINTINDFFLENIGYKKKKTLGASLKHAVLNYENLSYENKETLFNPSIIKILSEIKFADILEYFRKPITPSCCILPSSLFMNSWLLIKKLF